MPLEICRCCAGRMTASSPRNPNICVGCEQLLEDDSAELEQLLAGLAAPEAEAHAAGREKSGAEATAAARHETPRSARSVWSAVASAPLSDGTTAKKYTYIIRRPESEHRVLVELTA